MAHFSFRVDTGEMADSIDGVSRHVDGVTAAVVAMESAVILAEKEGADNICRNVNFGFYSLIRSQVSQKLAKHKSEAEAKLMELQSQSAALISIKGRMEKDFNMIASRYTKLFDSLNNSLRSRVFELDKPTTNFLFKDVSQVDSRPKRLAANPAINQNESLAQCVAISVSNTKFNGRNNIASMGQFVQNSEDQRSLVDSILSDVKVEGPQTLFVPVLVAESCDINVKQNVWSVNVSPIGAPADLRIQSSVSEVVTRLNWQGVDAHNENQVKREFSLLVLESQLPDRVKRTITGLMDSSKTWNGLSGGVAR
ncbi:MAG: hypothetical protein H6603_10195 [Flavobacteriales bacterium]|nr:hypothetical protein [Flavobacteriales bacterium]